MGTKYAAPPVYLPESQLVQRKIGNGVGGSSANITAGPVNMLDATGAAMQIALTPQVNCFWQVYGEFIVDSVDSIWNSMRWDILLNTPDLDGEQFVGQGIFLTHNDIVPWTQERLIGDFKLQAGTAYTATMRWVPPTGFSHFYWTGDPHIGLKGMTFGHGAF